eukprot:CAMPEP_0181215980 /NCGR_PEP_ID=MMETSP1096-20121128/26323_1 /TAXON_ID=156174 ORGANISM="Chrysochromulina ericina, Strain CCMP281" /NCGR_SAMPLE_ID=MMETSP1096 /ASSEMBLY_ACC=CAM_ASM_000453 /LENGTH=113 /DNA_ID=CAMNT_0023307913 /DNA_START=257 /DNA_END=599 /DNA_ORIENTATION=+
MSTLGGAAVAAVGVPQAAAVRAASMAAVGHTGARPLVHGHWCTATGAPRRPIPARRGTDVRPVGNTHNDDAAAAPPDNGLQESIEPEWTWAPDKAHADSLQMLTQTNQHLPTH